MSGNSDVAAGHSNVYVRGLPLDIDESLLTSLFQPHGSVQSVRIFRSNQVKASNRRQAGPY